MAVVADSAGLATSELVMVEEAMVVMVAEVVGKDTVARVVVAEMEVEMGEVMGVAMAQAKEALMEEATGVGAVAEATVVEEAVVVVALEEVKWVVGMVAVEKAEEAMAADLWEAATVALAALEKAAVRVLVTRVEEGWEAAVEAVMAPVMAVAASVVVAERVEAVVT